MKFTFMTSKTVSEEIFTGVVAFRPGSLTPIIRVIIREEAHYIPIMVEDYDRAREKDGQTIKFTIIKSPYGPNIVSDNGFAKLL